MESNDFLNLAIAYYKDKVRHEILKKFRDESLLLLKADADARRQIAKENIIAMAKLKNELAKFEFIYTTIKNEFGNVEAVDNYILQIKINIKRLSYEKNNLR